MGHLPLIYPLYCLLDAAGEAVAAAWSSWVSFGCGWRSCGSCAGTAESQLLETKASHLAAWSYLLSLRCTWRSCGSCAGTIEPQLFETKARHLAACLLLFSAGDRTGGDELVPQLDIVGPGGPHLPLCEDRLGQLHPCIKKKLDTFSKMTLNTISNKKRFKKIKMVV